MNQMKTDAKQFHCIRKSVLSTLVSGGRFSLLSFALAWFFGSPTANASTPIYIEAKDVSAPVLANRVAELTQLSVAFFGDPRARISMKGVFRTSADLLSAFTHSTGLKHIEIDNVHVFVPDACKPDFTHQAPVLLGDRLGLSFDQISPLGVALVLRDFSFGNSGGSGEATFVDRRLMSIRSNFLSAQTIYKVVSSVSGIRLVIGAGGNVSVGKYPVPSCISMPANDEEAHALLSQIREPPPPTCPRFLNDIERGIESPSKCSDLEHFAAKDLTWRARLVIPGKTMAVLEAPNGFSRSIKVGDYLGYHYGKVVAIEPAGIAVREIKVDGSGIYREYRFRLDPDSRIVNLE